MKYFVMMFLSVLAYMPGSSISEEEYMGRIVVKSGEQIMLCDLASYHATYKPFGFTMMIPDSCANVISKVYRYDDVPSSHWAFWAIDAVSYAGITSGCGEGKFCPDAKVTRAELAVMLSRALGLPLRNSSARKAAMGEVSKAAGLVEGEKE